MPSEYLEDRNGNKSSKRLVGSILITFGVLEKLCLFCVGLKAKELMANFTNLDSCANTLIYAGAALLGVSVLEFLAPKNENTNS